MMFVFAYLGGVSGSNNWPIQLIHNTEWAFVITAVVCLVLAIAVGQRAAEPVRDLIAIIGGASAGLGLVMPFELAPFFFNARGEIMMMSIALILVYPIAIFAFFLLFRAIASGGVFKPPSR